MLSIDMKFTAIITTHASAAIYGPMLSPRSPLSPVFFQLDENIFQELIYLWATVSAITCWQIFCNDCCSIYSVVWNGITLPFFLGYRILRSLLSTGPFTVDRMFRSFRDTMVILVLSGSILIYYAKSGFFSVCTLRIRLTMSRIQTTLKESFCSVGACKIAVPPAAKLVRFNENPIIYYRARSISRASTDSITVCTDSESPQNSEETSAEEGCDMNFKEPGKPEEKEPSNLGYNISETAEQQDEDDTIDAENQAAAFFDGMCDAYNVLSRDIGVPEEFPVITWEDKVLYNVFVVKCLLEEIVNFTEQLNASRGARAEICLKRSNFALNGDPMRWMLYYCYNIGIQAVESCNPEFETKGTMRRKFESAMHMGMDEISGKKKSALIKAIFQTYNSYTSSFAYDRLDYDEECKLFQNCLSQSVLTKSQIDSIRRCLFCLDDVVTGIFEGIPYDIIQPLKIIQAYYSFKDCYEEFKIHLKAREERQEDFCDFIDWADQRKLEDQHEYYVDKINQFSDWDEGQFSRDYALYKRIWESNLPRHKVKLNRVRRNATNWVRNMRRRS